MPTVSQNPGVIQQVAPEGGVKSGDFYELPGSVNNARYIGVVVRDAAEGELFNIDTGAHIRAELAGDATTAGKVAYAEVADDAFTGKVGALAGIAGRPIGYFTQGADAGDEAEVALERVHGLADSQVL